MFRIPAIHLAEAQQRHQAETHMYLFAWSSPAARGRLGACHGVELPFLFGTLDAPGMARFAGTGPDAEALSRTMMDAWAAFAHGQARFLDRDRPWPTYDCQRRTTVVFDRITAVIDGPMEAERRAWDGLLG
jgi:para-nitrobenzyl esterase